MVTENLFIDPSLVEIQMTEYERDQVISKLSKLLYSGGYVKDTYEKAVLAREAVFPTGLPFAIGVAIPHTDSEHVNQNALAIATLKKPVIFEEMGSRGKQVATSIVCMMAIKDPSSVVKVLQRLILAFQQTYILEQLLNSPNCETIVEILQEQMSDMAFADKNNKGEEIS